MSDDSDFPPSSAQMKTPPNGTHACLNDRRIRDIEREIKEQRNRLGHGDVCMATLQSSVDTLKESVDRLNNSVTELSKPNPLFQKVLDAFIQWAVPAIIIVVIWGLVKSGAVDIKQDSQDRTQKVQP